MAATTSSGGGGSSVCIIPPQSEYLRTHRVIGSCPQPEGTCKAGSPTTPLLTAQQIHPDAQLVAADGNLLVAEVPAAEGDGATSFVVQTSTHNDGSFDYAVLPFQEPPVPTMKLRDLSGGHLLLCDLAACQLYQINTEEVLLIGTVPPEIEAEGVVWLSSVGICAFGNGIQCRIDGDWTEILPADSGARLHDADTGSTAIWAAGDDGRVVVATTSCWLELSSGTSAPLRTISTDPSREFWATAAGDGGVVVHLSLDETISCTYGDAAWVAMHRTWGHHWGYGIAHQYDELWLVPAAGQMTWGVPSHTGNWCTYDVDSPIVDITSSSCGISENSRYITADALYGGAYCALD